MTLSRRELVQHSASAAALFSLGALPGAARAGQPRAQSGAAQARLPRAQLRALRAAVRGPVSAPGDGGYAAASVLFNTRFDGVRPPAVVRARDVADVRAAVRWAGRFDVPLVVRAGGHAYHGGSTSGKAVVLDVGRLDRIAHADGIATLGPGARNIDVYAALARRGVTLPSGSCPTVAVGGLVLGGGMGLAGRELGLLLDRVRSFDVVTADGALRRVDAGTDPDLFWALRGGGGSFGVVTAARLRVRRVGRAAWFFASFPAAARAQALAVWDDLAPGAPDALTAILTLRPDGASALGQWFGSEAALRRLLAPLARIPGARLSAGTSDYLALQRRWAGCADGGLAACRRFERTAFAASSVYVARPLSPRGQRAFVDAADTGATLVLDAYGGAIGRVEPAATAFVHRDVRFSVQILSYTTLGVARPRVRRARALIAPHGNGRAYQNYADLDLPAPRSAYYGANLARLEQVKAAVDPADRFRPAQGVSPRP